jgi:archaellum component FlaD/FlaE
VGGTIEVLRYYRGIGWITRDVEADLRGYFGGLDDGEGRGSLGVDEHTESLVYVTRLASMTGRSE